MLLVVFCGITSAQFSRGTYIPQNTIPTPLDGYTNIYNTSNQEQRTSKIVSKLKQYINQKLESSNNDYELWSKIVHELDTSQKKSKSTLVKEISYRLYLDIGWRNTYYIKKHNNIYTSRELKLVEWIDIDSFEVINDSIWIAKDKNWYIYNGLQTLEVIDKSWNKLDLSSFKHLWVRGFNMNYYQDNSYIYCWSFFLWRSNRTNILPDWRVQEDFLERIDKNKNTTAFNLNGNLRQIVINNKIFSECNDTGAIYSWSQKDQFSN